MNTHGHEDVAKAAGIPLLENVFGKDKRSLHALHLGNWLTDVSQVIDPVTFNNLTNKSPQEKNKSKEEFDALIEEILATTFEGFNISPESLIGHKLKSLKPELQHYVDEAKKSLNESLDFIFAAQTNDRDSQWAKFFHDTFLVIGYYKFVHQNARNQLPRMNFECFMRVFGRPDNATHATDRPGSFTQYYPHEHLDRPECFPPKEPPVYAPGPQSKGEGNQLQIASGKPFGMRSPRSPHYKKRLEKDIYSYLRDDIEMTAGLLAEVDREFAKAADGNLRDEDPKWYKTLAKLGHALHQVEDFFAHSNWVELAALRLGESFVSKVIPKETPLEVTNRANTIFDKRLRRHLTKPLDNSDDHPDERWVVTGYFDSSDTQISILHILEEILGWHVPDPYAVGHDQFKSIQEALQKPKTALYEAQKTMQDTLDFITNPKRALNDRDNNVAQSLKKKYEADLDKLRRPGVSKKTAADIEKETVLLRNVAKDVTKETDVLHNAPGEIQRAFLNLIVNGSRLITLGKVTKSLYESIGDIAEFILNPLGWLPKWLPDYLKQKVEDALKFYAKERVYSFIGSDRIGCHSLLAKDHGLEPFYKYQKECATAVHWYIVNTLLRHWTAKDDNKGYIDWLELLEYFLRNPLSLENVSYKESEIEIPVTLIHTVAQNEQLKARNPLYSLEYKFKKTAIDPAQFTWRTIADANFETYDLTEKQAQQVINKVLSDKTWAGYPVKPPNYAFKTGLRILIPQQRRVIKFRDPVEAPPWFQEVMEKGWKVFTGYGDPEDEKSKMPIEHHKPRIISDAQLEQIILRGKDLRRKAREAYRPNARGQCP